MAARKSTAKKKTVRKRAPRRPSVARARPKPRRIGALAQLEKELPKTLRQFSTRMRRNLTHLERKIEKEGRDARRQATRMLRQASHRLGHLEALGEREWRKQSLRARQGAVRLLRQLEHAVEPPRRARGGRRARSA